MRRQHLISALIVLGITLGLGPTMAGAGEVLQSATSFVRGEILRIDGPEWTIRDQSGREVRLRVDGSTTKAEDNFQVGDHVAVDMTPQGRAGLMVKIPNGK